MNRVIHIIPCALALSACATTGLPKGEPVTLDEVIRQIKSDVGEYNEYASDHAKDPRLGTVCGGKIDLAIKAATVSVTTVTKTAGGESIGAEVSPAAFLKVTAGGSQGRSYESSQVLTFTLEPAASDAKARPTGAAASHSQLYLALTNLRESLLRASDMTPCLHFPEKDQDNSVEFGFTATKNQAFGGSINLFIFAIGANRSDERTAAHTIKIAFEGKGQAVYSQ